MLTTRGGGIVTACLLPSAASLHTSFNSCSPLPHARFIQCFHSFIPFFEEVWHTAFLGLYLLLSETCTPFFTGKHVQVCLLRLLVGIYVLQIMFISVRFQPSTIIVFFNQYHRRIILAPKLHSEFNDEKNPIAIGNNHACI